MHFIRRRVFLSLIAVCLAVTQLFWGIPLKDLFAAEAVGGGVRLEASPVAILGGPPLSRADVTYQSIAGDSKAPVLFLIEDAHGSLDAQENIKITLKELTAQFPDSQIFVEGTARPVDWDFFWRFPDKKARKLAARYFLEEGRMSGAEVYSAVETNGQILQGLENESVYRANVKAYLETAALKPTGEQGLEQIEKGLNRLKGRLFTSELRNWTREREIYEQNPATQLLRYLKFLSTWAQREEIGLESYPHIKKLMALSARPAKESARALETEKRSFALELFSEKESLEDAVLKRADLDPLTRELIHQLKGAELLRKLFSLELSRPEWQRLASVKSSALLETIENFLIPYASEFRIDLSASPELLASLEASRSFYERASEREKYLCENLEKTRSGSAPAIVVAGGFHSEGFRDYFRKKNYSIFQISPKIENTRRTVPYWEIFEGARTPLEAWFAGSKSFGVSQKAGESLLAKETARFDPAFISAAKTALIAGSLVSGVSSEADAQQFLADDSAFPKVFLREDHLVIETAKGETIQVTPQVFSDGDFKLTLKPFALTPAPKRAEPPSSAAGIALPPVPRDVSDSGEISGRSLGGGETVVIAAFTSSAAAIVWLWKKYKDEKVRAEKAEALYEQFRKTFTDNPLPQHRLDEKGTILEVNPRWLEFLGYSEDEAVGQSFLKFIPEDERQNAWGRFQAKIENLDEPPREKSRNFLNRKGIGLPVATKDVSIRNPEGRLEIVTTLINLDTFETERKQRELFYDINALLNEILKKKDLNEVFQTIVENLTKLFGFDRAGINFWQKNENTNVFEAKVGYQYHADPKTRPEVNPEGKIVSRTEMGLTARALRAWEERTGDYVLIEDYREDAGKYRAVQTEVARKAGIVFSISFPIFFEKEMAGNIIFSTTNRDYQFDRQNEPILQWLVDILSTAILFKKTSENLAEESRGKTMILRGTAHDIRGKLAAMIGFTNFIVNETAENRKRPGPPRIELIREFAIRVFDSGKQIESFMNNTLTEQQVASGHFELHPQATDLKAQLEGIVEDYRERAKVRELTITSEIDPFLPPSVELDSFNLGRIFSNLVENAIKNTEKGGIVIRASRLAADSGKDRRVRVRFAVEDTGPGIPADKLKNLTLPFSQMKESDRRQGFGLGHSIVKAILEKMESDLQIKTELGKGSSFYFDLNLKELEKPAEQSGITEKPATVATDQSPASVVSPKSGQPKRIERVLIIEDNADHLLLAERYISGYREEIEVPHADSFDSALKQAVSETQGPDVILLDLNGVPGFEIDSDTVRFIQEAKAAHPAVEILLISGLDLAEIPAEIWKALRAETNEQKTAAHFSKNYWTPEEFKRRLEAVEQKLQVEAKSLGETAGKNLGFDRIFVVDDDKKLLETLKETFESHYPYPVAAFENPTKAFQEIQKLKLENPDTRILLVTDFDMPNMNGGQLIEEVRKEFPAAFVVLQSALAWTPKLQQLAESGKANVFLPKPYSLAQVLKVDEWAAESARLSGQSLGQGAKEPAEAKALLEEVQNAPFLNEYFRTLHGKKDELLGFLGGIIKARDANEPIALVFSWETFREGAMAEEIAFLLKTLPNLKIYIASPLNYTDLEGELSFFDPKMALKPYREWGAKKQFNLFPGKSIQEVRNETLIHVGKNTEGEKRTAVLVKAENEEEIRSLGTAGLNRMLAYQHPQKSKEEGRLIGLASLGLRIILGAQDLPENVERDEQGVYRVYALSLGEISANLLRELMARERLAQAA